MAVVVLSRGRNNKRRTAAMLALLQLLVLLSGQTISAQTLSDFINAPSTNDPGAYGVDAYNSNPYYSVTRLPHLYSTHLKKRNEPPSQMKKPPIKKNFGCSRFRGRLYDMCVTNQVAKSSKGKGTSKKNSKSMKGKKGSKSVKGKGYQTSKPRPRPSPSPAPYSTSPRTSTPAQSETLGPSAPMPTPTLDTDSPLSSTVSPTTQDGPSFTLFPTRVLPVFSFSPMVMGSPVPTTVNVNTPAPSFPSASTDAPMTTGSTSPSVPVVPSLTSAPTTLDGNGPTSVPITGGPAGTESPAFTLAPAGQGGPTTAQPAGSGATNSPTVRGTGGGGGTTAPTTNSTEGGGGGTPSPFAGPSGTAAPSARVSGPTTVQPAGSGATISPSVKGTGGGGGTTAPSTNITGDGGGGGTFSPSFVGPSGTAAPSAPVLSPTTAQPAGSGETSSPTVRGTGGGGGGTTAPSTNSTGGGGGGGTPAPSIVGPGGTAAPFDGGGNGTMAPTSDGTNRGTRSGTTNRVSATPFALLSDINGAEFSEEEADAASDVTEMYLEEFLVGQFSGNFGVNVESVQVEIIESATSPDGAAVLAFRITTTFPPDSSFVPEVAELDVLVELAFTEPSDFIALLQELPSGNPFSTTSSILYEQRSDLNRIGERIPTDTMDPQHQGSFGGSFGLSTPPPQNEAADFDVTPFTVSFDFNGSDPTEDDTAETSLITIAFLNEYLTKMFDDIAPDAFEKLMGSGRAGLNDPREIGFLLAIRTAEGYSVAAPQNDIDMIVAAAFQEPSVGDLIYTLQSLSPENPYSATTTVEYRSIPTNSTSVPFRAEMSNQSASNTSPLMIASVVTVGVLVLAVLAVFISLHQGRRGDGNFRKDATLLDCHKTTGSNNLLDLISDGSSQPGVVFRNESLSSGIPDDFRNDEVREYNLASTFLNQSTEELLLRSSWNLNDEFLGGEQEYPGALHNTNRAHRSSSSIPLGNFQEKLRAEPPEPPGRSDDILVRCQTKPLEP